MNRRDTLGGLADMSLPPDAPSWEAEHRFGASGLTPPPERSVEDAYRMGGLAGMDTYQEAKPPAWSQRKDPRDVWKAIDAAAAERDVAPNQYLPPHLMTGQETPRVAQAHGALPDEAIDALRWHGLGDAVAGMAGASRAAQIIPNPLARAAVMAGGLMGGSMLMSEAQAKPKVGGILNVGDIGAATRKVLARDTVENWLPVSPKPYVGEPERVFAPGVYKNPRSIAAEANARVAPEHPAMKKLFGVTRDDLYEISQQGRREGNITDPGLFAPKKPGGSYAAEATMNPANAQRLIDTLTEAKKFPDLARGMIPWYVMDPAFQQMVKLVGRERAVAEYTKFNSMMTPFSASSDVMKEINRGTAARMMAERGQWSDFVKYGGMPVEKRGADFPPEMAGVIPHLRHAPTHTDPVTKYLATGRHGYGDDTVKIPLYTQASGVPETGFQTRFPVPDAHFTRASGMADVRQNAGPGDYMGGSEWRTFSPWFRESVAKPVDIEAVPAQALMWGAYGPQTGVKTLIGAPKLELLSQRIWERAHDLGIKPEKLRDDVLRGKAHAQWLIGAPLGAAMMGGVAAQDRYD